MTRPRAISTHYKILCASGVLVQGGSPDFLACVAAAKEAKAAWVPLLPDSTLRVQFFYPNRKRVPSADVTAALLALTNKDVAAAVARRRAAAAKISPARSEARTAEICAVVGRGFAVEVAGAFSQAGVVAPPDGLTHETLGIAGSVGISV